MPNLRLPLTDRICARAKSEAREYALRDTRLPGLILRVQPRGTRSWTFRIRKDGKPMRHLLGAFPDTPVEEARRIANALLAGDAEPPTQLSNAPLFEVFQAEHETRCGAFYKAEGLRTYKSYIRREILPAFAGKRLDAITRQDVVRWFEGYSATRPGGANRALGILGQMLGRAKAWGYMPEGWRSPVTGIAMNRRRRLGTFLCEDQMMRLGAILDVRIAESCAASALLRFLTLTVCRVGEAVDLEWRDVLTDRLRLRDSKTGPRDVALRLPVWQYLKAHRGAIPRRRARAPGAPVFPLVGGQCYAAVRSQWLSVRRDAELPPRLRIHDLRHSFASHAVMSGETLFTTSRLLGHSRVQMTARYAHLADTTLLETAERIGAIMLAQAGLAARRSSHLNPRD